MAEEQTFKVLKKYADLEPVRTASGFKSILVSFHFPFLTETQASEPLTLPAQVRTFSTLADRGIERK